MKDDVSKERRDDDRFPRNYDPSDPGASFNVGRRAFGHPLQPGFSLGAIAPHDDAPMRTLLADVDKGAEYADRANDVLAAALALRSEEAERALDRHADVWIKWARFRGVAPEAASPSAVAEHVVHLGAKIGLSEITRRRQAISEIHQRAGNSDPTRHELVDRAFEVATRARGKSRELAIRPILADDYRRIISAIPMRSLCDLRDRVAIGIGWEALATSNETVVLPVGSVQFTPDGLVVSLRGKWSRTLTIARREDHDLVAAVRDWMDRAHVVDGPLIRALRGEKIGSEEMVTNTLRKIIKTRAAAVGIPADNVTWRSLRNGYLANGMMRDMDEFGLAQRAGYLNTRPLGHIAKNVVPKA